jgi:hypothetical protein
MKRGTPVARIPLVVRHTRESIMATNTRQSWKGERASVSHANKSRPRSNRYSGGDTHKKPASGSRMQVWVGGYTRADGSKVKGHYRGT